MALRLLEIVVPEQHVNEILTLLDDARITDYWQTCSCDSKVIYKLILPAESTEKIMDELEKQHGYSSDFRMTLLPVEATYPGPQQIEEKNGENSEPESEERIPLRVSRQELYSEIFDNSKLTDTYLILVGLSTIVASIGLLTNNIAVIIGAMVIAPLLGPNVSLAFATTMGDSELGINALKTNIAGIMVAFVISVLLGFFLPVDPGSQEIHARTVVSYADIILALASGVAGALAFTSGLSTALIGVMVAVALIPPLVTFGLLVGGRFPAQSTGAFMLLVINMICLNIAGVVTFLFKGLQPLYWWEASKARKATRYAIGIWVVLLLLLLLLMFVSAN